MRHSGVHFDLPRHAQADRRPTSGRRLDGLPPVSRVRQSLYIVAGCTSTTRAFNLYHQCWARRATTQEQTAAIRTRVDDGTTAFPRAFPRKNKIAYFFAVLEDLLGVREEREDDPTEEHGATGDQRPLRFGQLPRR